MTDLPSPVGVDPSSPTPLYHQIFLLFRQKILAGELSLGDRLPSEEEISSHFSVSRITAKRAMNDLAAEGLVVRTRGRGTTVAKELETKTVNADFEGLMENLVAIGLSTKATVIALKYVPAPPEIARILKIENGADLQKVERYRERDGERFSHMLTYVPAEIGRQFEARDLGEHPILELIEATGHIAAEAEQNITAVLADPSLARHLKTSIGAPLLQVRRTVSDKDGTPIQHIIIHYLPEAYQLKMHLKRGRHGANGANVWTPTGP